MYTERSAPGVQMESVQPNHNWPLTPALELLQGLYESNCQRNKEQTVFKPADDVR